MKKITIIILTLGFGFAVQAQTSDSISTPVSPKVSNYKNNISVKTNVAATKIAAPKVTPKSTVTPVAQKAIVPSSTKGNQAETKPLPNATKVEE